MRYYAFDMIDSQGQKSCELYQFGSMEEAQAHVLGVGWTITKITVYAGEPPIYEFEATDPKGQVIADTIAAVSQDAAETHIERMGYVVTKISVSSVDEDD